jgi:hypothetical protein
MKPFLRLTLAASFVLVTAAFSILLLDLGLRSSALASNCQVLSSGHQVCILKINRSAKKYWEYWASISIDGVKRPAETYNCRGRTILRQNGIVIPFSQDNAGDLVCRLFKSR